MSILNAVKSKPVLWSGAAIILIGAVYYLASGSNSTVATSDGVDPSTVAAAAAIQQAQLQAQQQGVQTAAAVQANQDTIGGQISLANIATQSQDFIANLQATIASQQINATEQDTALTSTLTAQTTQAAIQAQTDQQQIQATASTTNTQTLANALVSEANTSAQVAIAGINNQCNGWFC